MPNTTYPSLTAAQEAWAQKKALETCCQSEEPHLACKGDKCQHPGEGWRTCVYLLTARLVAEVHLNKDGSRKV